jgi:adenine-specific DNA-methyltransferase
VFGETNLLADISWEKRYTRSNNAKLFSSVKDSLLCYRNSNELVKLREPRDEDSDSIYSNPDDDPRGEWTSVLYVNPASKEERPNLVYSITNPHTGEEITHPTSAWKYSPETHQEHVEEDRLYWGEDGEYEYPRLKKFLSEVGGLVPTDIWDWEDTGTTDSASTNLKEIFGYDVFDNPKPTKLIERIAKIRINGSENKNGLYLDFFAGSGSTAHSLINLNRESDGSRDYLLIEMAEYFDTVLRPRIQKIVFSDEWSEGTPGAPNGQSHTVKYHRLESYEDALNNVSLEEPTGPQQTLFEEEMDGYTLYYMLEFESEGSPTLLPEGTFDEPFDHELQIEQNGTSREPNMVDLVETFHYLIGAKVRKYWRESHQERKYVVTECDVGDEKTLIIWRRKGDLSYEDEKEWVEGKFDPATYDRVYVNGESYIERSEPLEIEFRERMEVAPDVE